MDELREALKELENFVKKTLAKRIEHYGYNPRAQKNTLQGSNLEQSINVMTSANILALQIADYWEYVACGWARSHEFSGTYSQFVININKWVRDKGLSKRFKGMNENQIAFMFFKFFTKNGIVGRPFMFYNEEGYLDEMIPELKDYMEKWCDALFETIMSDTDNWFNN